jgi:prepilin-type processing-associated H-X9-DG protein
MGDIYDHPTKASGLTIPGPTETWVYLDEHPDSINDAGCFPPNSSANIVDIPATYHNGAAGLAFADGHSEIHKWTGPTMRGTMSKVTITPRVNVATKAPDPDVRWYSYKSPRKSEKVY